MTILLGSQPQVPYEKTCRWKDFLRNPPSPVTTQTIPWPPAVLGAPRSSMGLTAVLAPKGVRCNAAAGAAGMLDGMRRAAETQGQACDSQAKASPELDTLKHWIRTATLRWHPDKFMANFGSRLQPDDRQAIVQRVHEIWHCLQQEMSMLAASMSCRS